MWRRTSWATPTIWYLPVERGQGAIDDCGQLGGSQHRSVATIRTHGRQQARAESPTVDNLGIYGRTWAKGRGAQERPQKTPNPICKSKTFKLEKKLIVVGALTAAHGS